MLNQSREFKTLSVVLLNTGRHELVDTSHSLTNESLRLQNMLTSFPPSIPAETEGNPGETTRYLDGGLWG